MFNKPDGNLCDDKSLKESHRFTLVSVAQGLKNREQVESAITEIPGVHSFV